MEALLLGIYAFFVWLIFIKFKWLPWNTTSQVTVVIIPIVALTALILALNIVAPSTNDVRVIKYVVQVIPQVRGRVIEVPVEPNRLVRKGELLFRIDPTQYQNDLNVAKAKLAADEAKFAQAGAGRGGSVGRARAIAGTTEIRQRTGRLAAAKAGTRAAARPAEQGTGGDGRRRQVRAGTGRGQCDRTGRPDRDSDGERSAGHAEIVGAGQRRAGVGRVGEGRSSLPRKRRST